MLVSSRLARQASVWQQSPQILLRSSSDQLASDLLLTVVPVSQQLAELNEQSINMERTSRNSSAPCQSQQRVADQFLVTMKVFFYFICITCDCFNVRLRNKHCVSSLETSVKRLQSHQVTWSIPNNKGFGLMRGHAIQQII